MSRLFEGTGTALVTGFTNNDEIYWDGYAELIELQISHGIDFIVPCGTTGESPTLTHEEHIRLNAFAVDKAAGRTKVLAGTGSNSTKEAVWMTKEAKKSGVDGVLVVSPYYNRPNDDGIRDYFEKIAAVGSPVVLYDVPTRTGKAVSTELIISLMEDGVISGLKWSSRNLRQIEKVLALAPDNFSVLSGNDDDNLAALFIGAHGVVSVASNVIPREIKQLVSLALNGQLEEARRHNFELSRFIEALGYNTNPMPIKVAMEIKFPEMINSRVRSPLLQTASQGRTNMENVFCDMFP